MLFEIFSLRYERAATMVTSNLPFHEWTEVLGSERLTGALLDRLTHHVHILEMNGEADPTATTYVQAQRVLEAGIATAGLRNAFRRRTLLTFGGTIFVTPLPAALSCWELISEPSRS